MEDKTKLEHTNKRPQKNLLAEQKLLLEEKKRGVIDVLFVIIIFCVFGLVVLNYRGKTQVRGQHDFIRSVKEAAECANKKIESEAFVLSLLHDRFKKGLPFFSVEEMFFVSLINKYDASSFGDKREEIFEDLFSKIKPLPLNFYEAQALWIAKNTPSEEEKNIFGSYRWDNGRYVSRRFSSLCEDAEAFATNINSLKEFKSWRQARNAILKDKQEVDMLSLIHLFPERTPSEQAYKKGLKELFLKIKS